MALRILSREFYRRLMRKDVAVLTLQVFAVSVVLWQFDPGGVSTSTQNVSTALFYRVIAPMYPGLKDDSNEPDDQPVKIVAIILNDESLNRIKVNEATGQICVEKPELGQGVVFCPDSSGGVTLTKEERPLELKDQTWPASFAIHAAVLRKILGAADFAAPKAIFVDFGFFDRRSDQEVAYLREVLCRYAEPPPDHLLRPWNQPQKRRDVCGAQGPAGDETRIPIFVSGLGSDTRSGLSVIPEFAAAATSQVSTRYIGEDPLTYNKYLRYDCRAGLPSAAQALHDAGKSWTSPARGDCPGIGPSEEDPARAEERYRRLDERNSFPLFWATWGNKERSRGIFACRTLPRSSLMRALWELLPPVAKAIDWVFGPDAGAAYTDESGEVRQYCPPHLSITAHDLLADDTGIEILLDGWYVLYGSNFTMAEDLVRPPTHGPIPGVFLHAMALDNLDQWRKVNQSEANLASWMILALFAGALSEALRGRGQSILEEGSGDDSRAKFFWRYVEAVLWFCFCAAFFLVAISIITAASFFSGSPPINFVGSGLIIAVTMCSSLFKMIIQEAGRWFIGPFTNTAIRLYRGLRSRRLNRLK